MKLIINLIIIVAIVLIIRLFGWWMLGIDEVISNQKVILTALNKNNKKTHDLN